MAKKKPLTEVTVIVSETPPALRRDSLPQNGKPANSKHPPDKNPTAVPICRQDGFMGGEARAQKLTKAQRVKIARKAAQQRWAFGR